MTSQPPSLLFQHHVFHEIRTPTVNKHARLVEIGSSRTAPDMESNETSAARETNPADNVKLEEENLKMAETACAEEVGPKL